MLFKNEGSFLNDCDKINNIWDDVRLRVAPTGSVCPICAIFRPATKRGVAKILICYTPFLFFYFLTSSNDFACV